MNIDTYKAATYIKNASRNPGLTGRGSRRRARAGPHAGLRPPPVLSFAVSSDTLTLCSVLFLNTEQLCEMNASIMLL